MQSHGDSAGVEVNAGSKFYWLLPAIFCFLFGVAIIANTQPAGDGIWFWYAEFLHQGTRLYSSMHLSLQPLYILETDAWTRIAGQGWLLSKVPALVHVLGLISALVLLLRESNWPDRQKSLLLAGTFLVSLQFVAYRFDDYHVVADVFVLYSVLLLLRISKAHDIPRRLLLAGLLGVLVGLTAMTRINDGAGLFAAVAICLFVMIPEGRLIAFAAFSLATAITCLLVIKATGDTLHAYVLNSILLAAGSKGGTGSVLLYPLGLVRNCAAILKHQAWGLLFVLALAVVCPLLAARFKKGFRSLLLLQLVCAGLLLAVPPIRLGAESAGGGVNVPVVAALDLLAIGLIFWIVARGIQSRGSTEARQWDPRELLLLIPLSQLASGSMSSAGHPDSLYPPVAVMILLAAIVSPGILQQRLARTMFLSTLAIMAVSVIGEKVDDPFRWHSYVSAPMFEGRTLYHHPEFGPMIIEKDVLALMEPICRDVRQPGSSRELLSLPLPYGNYFCDVPPWHGYVQTFFDTSSRQTIDGLIAELETKPPQWILYQRQLQNLSMHEFIYNHQQPLPQRALDTLIVRKVATGAWKVAGEKHYGEGEGWFLIETRP